MSVDTKKIEWDEDDVCTIQPYSVLKVMGEVPDDEDPIEDRLNIIESILKFLFGWIFK